LRERKRLLYDIHPSGKKEVITRAERESESESESESERERKRERKGRREREQEKERERETSVRNTCIRRAERARKREREKKRERGKKRERLLYDINPSEKHEEERWGAGVEYHFQEFNEPYAPS